MSLVVAIASAGAPSAAPISTAVGIAGAGDVTFVWQVTPYAALTLVAAVVAMVFAATLWQSSRGPGTMALTALALGAAAWSLLYGLELASTTLGAKLLFGRLSYLGIVVVPVSWFAFALAYTGRAAKMTPSTVGLLSLPAALAAALPWTSESNDLFWASTSLVSGASGPLLAIEYGPAFWLWSAYSYVLLAAGTALLLRSVPTDIRLFRAQTALLLVGVAAPWLANVTYLLRLFGPGTLDLTPLGFVVSALALGGGLRRFQLLDVHPAVRGVARDELVERMAEPVVVLNDEGQIVDLNRSAQSVLGGDTDDRDLVGKSLEATAPDLAAAIEAADGDTAEFTTGTPSRHYEVQVSPIHEDRGTVGWLVTLRDVTKRRRRERQLAVLNRVLRHDLRNDIAAVQASAELLTDDPGNDEYLAIIAEKAAEMEQLVQTVREVEQTLESGGPTLSDIDIVRVVDERAEAARRSYPDATVETALPASERVHSTDLVSSVIDNLVENAVEHNDTDTPHVRVSVDRVVEGEQPYVQIRVADDGPGIPEFDQRVLTGGEGTSLEAASGLGLGLVNWLVTESGGEVHYEPNEPRGSVVVLRLPAVEPEDGDDDDRAPDLDTDSDRSQTWSRSPTRSTSPAYRRFSPLGVPQDDSQTRLGVTEHRSDTGTG